MSTLSSWRLAGVMGLLFIAIFGPNILFDSQQKQPLLRTLQAELNDPMLHSEFSHVDNVHVANGRQLSDFVYDDPNGTYSPSLFVRYGHTLTGEEFEANEAYIKRALYSPILIFGLGLLSIIFLFIGMLFRCCVEDCKCLPDPLSEKYDRNKLVNTVFFYAFCLLVLIFDQLVFIGNTSISSGVNSFKSALSDAEVIVNNMVTYSADLVDESDDISSEYTALQSSCSPYASADPDVSTDISSFQSAADSLYSAVQDLPSKLTLVSGKINTYAVFYRNIALYVIWGLAIFCALFAIAMRLCQSTAGIKTFIGISTIVYLLYILLGIPWVLLTSIFGDLCMNPNYNIIKSLPASGDLQSIASYYATCYGNNTLQIYLDQSISGVDSLNSTIQELKPYCPDNADLIAMQNTINDISVTVADISTEIACPPLQSIWNKVVLDSLCGGLYNGIFYIWGSQLITSFFLFLLIWVAVYTYNYFDSSRIGPRGKVLPDEEEEEEDGDNEAMVEMVEK